MADKNIKTEINIEFAEASSRQSLNSGDEVKSLFGKLKKWLSDLKSVAFSGSYKDLIDKPSIPTVDIDKNYVDTQLKLKSDTTHTHNYAGSSSSGGAALSAEKLKTARNINGVSFDGAKDIDIPRSVKPMKRISGTAGASRYFKIAHINITGNYVNTPILLSYIQRSGKEATLYICFNSVANVDPTLAGFRGRSIRNQSIDAYICKSSTSTWDVYVKKVEAYDVLFITDCRLRNDGTNIYFDNDQVGDLPEGAIKATSEVYLDTDGADAAYLKKSAGGKLLYSGSMSTAGGSLTISNLADYSAVLLQTAGVGANGLNCGITAVVPISYISKGNSIQLYGGIPSSAYVTSSGVQAAKGMGGYITASMTAGSPTTLTLEQSVGTIGTIQIYSII